jgi:hypothetical protein
VDRQKHDRRELERYREHDRGPVADLHEAEQPGALAEQQSGEGAGGDADPAGAEQRPGSRCTGAASAPAISAAETKFSANSVPMVGIAE